MKIEEQICNYKNEHPEDEPSGVCFMIRMKLFIT